MHKYEDRFLLERKFICLCIMVLRFVHLLHILLFYGDFILSEEISEDEIDKRSSRRKRSGHDFNYDMQSEYGPPNWAHTWRECDGHQQSPINVFTEHAETLLYRINFKGMNMQHKGVFLNNGHAPTFQLSGPGSLMTGLPCFRHEKFMLKQFHFHFGPTDTDGTEHAIDGKRYAAELHMVHYNIKYGSFIKAVDKYDGLAVLAVLMEAKDDHSNEREYFDRFIKDFGTKILDPSTHGTQCSFNPFDITPNYHNFYYYKGSLTTPGCYQSVHWVIFKKRIYIKPETLEIFREMHTKHHGELISDKGNLRPLQDVYNRDIIINFYPTTPVKPFKTESCKAFKTLAMAKHK